MNHASPVATDPLTSAIGRIAAVLSGEHFPTGDRAALRRVNPDLPPSLTVYRFALHHLPEGWDATTARRKNWLALLAGMALMSPGAHDPKTPFGAALGRGGFAESRVERLLAATDDVRRTLLLRAARFLAAKAESFNWVDGARLLLTEDDDKRDALYRHIARHYYREVQKNQGQ